ncbi:endolytic transglycosylase MltG [Picosynechococcus sp. PCC 73109]|uniref:endolytic transglycosylase MltG n=1 Tax=Picosynechococcus sp. PCC 73109 TaxID=374982 RepID=UPI00074581B3|nr:endolytic transglycosylase MltG [Picosynechococcus sp. PCC 73109]AMA09408.1 aminodeoxychorismate lyase [Picosynechococcus sp. PCC 73109]
MPTNAPPKTQPLARRKRGFPWFSGILALTVAIAFWQSWAWWRWAIAPGENADQTVQLDIPVGTGAAQIGEDLTALGLIQSPKAWQIWVKWLRLTDRGGSLKAGTYQFPPNQDLPAIAQQIWSGDVVQTSVTIPEGWTIQQMANRFEALGFFPATEFIAATQTIPREQFPWLPADLTSLEGFLFPDTYFLDTAQPSPPAIIEQMLGQFEAVVLPLYEAETVPLDLSLTEWVTLASIVEKEAVIPEERPLIAGVFVNRLEQGMRLETDPTVEYGLGIRQTKEQPLTLEQVRTPNPYNTYLNEGLPPGAIASPGLASFRATSNPEATDFLFFVANYDGTHVFSETLAEHEAATQRIRATIDGETE